MARVCPCCLQDPQAAPFSLFCHIDELASCGLGYPLYFQLIKYAVLMCIVMGILEIPKIVRNVSANSCKETAPVNVCQRDWITMHSVANYGTSRLDIDDKLWSIISVGLFLLLLEVVRYQTSKKIERLSPETSSASDWSVQIKFKLTRPSEDQIKSLIYRIAPNVKIQKINSCYKLDEFTEQFNKVSLLKKELRRLKVQEFSRLREEKNKLIAQERENRASTNILGPEDNLEFSRLATEVAQFLT